MKIHMLTAALFVAAGFAGAAVAGPVAPNAAQVTVNSQGLDLTSDAGAAQFLDRLDAAVTRACDDHPTDGPALTLSRSRDFHACRNTTLEAAMAHVHSPAVQRLYAAMEAKEGVRLARR